MLRVLLPAPFLVGLFFKVTIPFVNGIIETKYSFSLSPWYGIADGMLVCLTPMFATMISAFLLLEERGEGIGAFYQITPAEGYSYVTACMGIPMVWAFSAAMLSLFFFNISKLSLITILSSSFISTLAGVSLGMMVVSIADNRVEGLTLSKLMGVSFLGLILIWFIPPPYQYFMSFLPSFWIGKLLLEGTSLFAVASGILVCILWVMFFTRRFLRRIS